MDTFCREYLPLIMPTDEVMDIAEDLMSLYEISEVLPAFIVFDIQDEDRARMTGMLT